jgi:hypothetical protein
MEGTCVLGVERLEYNGDFNWSDWLEKAMAHRLARWAILEGRSNQRD